MNQQEVTDALHPPLLIFSESKYWIINSMHFLCFSVTLNHLLPIVLIDSCQYKKEQE